MELIVCRKELSFGFLEIRYTVCSTARRCFVFFFLHKLRVENTLEKRILEGQYCNTTLT